MTVAQFTQMAKRLLYRNIDTNNKDTARHDFLLSLLVMAFKIGAASRAIGYGLEYEVEDDKNAA